jgi:uncharacterized protein (PEP-CTERM system associated)
MATGPLRRRRPNRSRAEARDRGVPMPTLPVPLPPQRCGPGAALLLLSLAAGSAAAQSGPGLRLVPSLSVGQTVTDAYEGDAGSGRRGEAITSLGAGLRMSGRGGWIEGTLDYSVSGLLHARDSKANNLQNRLSASLKAELVPRHIDLVALASITQQPVSALAVQTPDSVVSERNRSEVRVLSLRPTLRGRVAGAVDASASLAVTATDSGRAAADAQASDSTNGSASLSLASVGAGRLAWSLSAVRAVADFEAGRRTEDDRVIAALTLRPDVDWELRLRGGVEANDFRSTDKQRFDSWGAGLAWTPSPRTSVQLDADRRSFGHSHSVAMQHRSRRTVVRLSDSQDVSRGGGDTTQALVGAYDLFFELFASQEPDPDRRAQLVESVLQRNGLARDAQVAAGFLTSAVTLQRRQEVSLAVEAIRTSWVFSAFANRTRRIDTLSTGIDDTTTADVVRQRGLSVTVAHRLTPTGALSLSASTLRGSDGAGLGTELRSLSAGWSEQLGARTAFSLVLRHSEYDAATEPYNENAVIANLNLRF